MTKTESGFTCSIPEVAKWDKNGVEIPALQRGLVWAPQQVELLWDSILRGFPIGAFTLTPVSGNEGQLTHNTESLAKYFLLDGQQRYNAIRAAFSPLADDSKSVLWIDFMPPVQTNSTRRFWIKVITSAHPWGFANNDSCSVLGWGKYREALKLFTGSEDTRIQEVKLSKSWPIMARCPVPFSEVYELYERSSGEESAFCNGIVTWCNEHAEIGTATKDFIIVEKTCKVLFVALARMKDYPIVANIMKPEMLDECDVVKEGDFEDSGTNSLEQFFTRINTLGTPISPYDLRYSAIKAYWGDIKEANDSIASEIMPASHLAILTFRLALTLAMEKKGFADTPSVQRIRSLKKKDDAESEMVCRLVGELYSNDGIKLKSIIEHVEKALRVYKQDGDAEDGLPAVIRTSIIQNSPDVYLLLLYMDYKGQLENIGNLVGLATWLHWFSIGQQKVAVDAIKEIVDVGDFSSLKTILHGLCEKTVLMIPVEATNDNFLAPAKFLKENDTICDRASFEKESWYQLFDRFWSQREMVIFATRRTFNKEFQYDPAETKFLTGHNRPWDIDHIVPKSWVSRQRVQMGVWKDVCKDWIESNGNFAAIPFTLNRSKSNRSEWGYYDEHEHDLFFNPEVKDLQSDELTRNHDMAMKFVRITHGRLIEMYEEWRKEIADFL